MQAAEEGKKANPPLMETLKKAAWRASGGGLAGAGAMFINVGALMWMRTTVNYQYAKGSSTMEALSALYNEGGRGLGGIRRFYRGVGPALFQGPLSRFGDTAANAGTLALLEEFEQTRSLPTSVKTGCASAGAAGFRVFLMPIDACKTILQVEGANGLQILGQKIRTSGIGVLWHGSIGAMSATFVGHYPWFATYNYLQEYLPKVDKKKDGLAKYLGRNAIIGFCSSAVSDTCSNSVRVIKTTTQTSKVPIGYLEAVQMVVAKDGVGGLFFRGLQTKIISNGFQGVMFSVLWRLGQDYIEKSRADAEAAKK